MIVLWYPQNRNKEFVSNALSMHLQSKHLFQQQVQDWLNSRFPSFNQYMVYLTDEYKLVDTTCSICLEPSEKTTSCGHFFHHTCISKWKQVINTCPNCRSTL
jgi:hypothetical protein